MINRQAQLITEIYSSIPVYLLLCKTGLTPALILLDYCQQRYSLGLLSFYNLYSTKMIVFVSLKEGDKRFQHAEMPKNTLLWTENIWPTLYG